MPQPTTFAGRLGSLPGPDLSTDGTEVCDRAAAARVGAEADTVMDAAEQLLHALAPISVPAEIRARATVLGDAIERSRRKT